jgi:hypothetical protein
MVKLQREEMNVWDAVAKIVLSLDLTLLPNTVDVPIDDFLSAEEPWEAHNEFAEHARPLLNNTEPSPYLPLRKFLHTQHALHCQDAFMHVGGFRIQCPSLVNILIHPCRAKNQQAVLSASALPPG